MHSVSREGQGLDVPGHLFDRIQNDPARKIHREASWPVSLHVHPEKLALLNAPPWRDYQELLI